MLLLSTMLSDLPFGKLQRDYLGDLLPQLADPSPLGPLRRLPPPHARSADGSAL